MAAPKPPAIFLVLATLALAIGLIVARPWAPSKPSLKKLVRIEPPTSVPPTSRTDHFAPPPPKPDDRPAPISEDKIASFYKTGKQVQSIALLNVTGAGVNTNWAIEGKSHFAHQYRFAVATTVKENRGTVVTFELKVVEAVQPLAVSHKQVSLRLLDPDTPVSTLIDWADPVLIQWPPYKGVKKVAAFAQAMDPRLTKSLTAFSKLLESAGLPIDSSDLLFAGRVDELSGMQLELKYMSGIGCTGIKVLDGKTLSNDLLEQLAYNLTVTADYFVSVAADKNVGESTKLRMRDVAGFLSFGHDADIGGELLVQRANDMRLLGEPIQVLDIVGGAVTLRGTGVDQHQRASLKPLPGAGRLWFSHEKQLVRRLKASWQGNASWVSSGHLLFNTTKIRDVAIESNYEADVVPAAAAKAGGP